MGDSPRPSEGADASSTREDEAPGVSSGGEGGEASGAGSLAEAHALQGSDPSWAPVLTDIREESEELMELGAEDAETFESAASSYRDPTHPLLSDEEQEDGGTYFGSGS